MSRLYRPKLGRHRQRPIVILRPQPQPRPNSDPNIYIKDIATETPAGSNVWIINNDLTIGPGQYFAVGKDQTVITNYNLTNNGSFRNGGTFCFINKSKNFINNNAPFSNGDSNSVNFGTFVVNGTPRDLVTNRGGNIVNFGAKYEEVIVGNPVLNLTTPLRPH